MCTQRDPYKKLFSMRESNPPVLSDNGPSDQRVCQLRQPIMKKSGVPNRNRTSTPFGTSPSSWRGYHYATRTDGPPRRRSEPDLNVWFLPIPCLLIFGAMVITCWLSHRQNSSALFSKGLLPGRTSGNRGLPKCRHPPADAGKALRGDDGAQRHHRASRKILCQTLGGPLFEFTMKMVSP